MKLNTFQLEAHLTKKQFPFIYMINGDDVFQKSEAIRCIRKAAYESGFVERLRFNADQLQSDQLYTVLFSPSLLAEKRLIELDFREKAPNKTLTAILEDYGKSPSSHQLILIDNDKIDSKTAKSSWYQAIEKMAIVIQVWPIAREHLPAWIKQYAKKFQLQMEDDASQLLADYVEGNLAAAASAIKKIYLLQPKTKVNRELIHTLVTNECHFTIFDLVENLIAGNKERTIHILAVLKTNSIEPTLILWGITRELRFLAELLQQLKQGLTLDSLFKKHRIFSKREAAIRIFLKKFSLVDCWRHLSYAADIDKVIKGAAPGHVWDVLELLCLRICKL